MGLHVRFDKSDVAQTSFFGVGFPGRNKITATIDTHNGSSRADTPGYLNGSFAPSTSNIQDAISGAQHQLGEYFYAVLTKSPNQDVSPGVEFRNEYGGSRNRHIGWSARSKWRRSYLDSLHLPTAISRQRVRVSCPLQSPEGFQEAVIYRLEVLEIDVN